VTDPDPRLVPYPPEFVMRYRGAGLERNMGDVGNGVGLLRVMVGSRQGLRYRTRIENGFLRIVPFVRSLLQVIEQFFVRRLRL